jgi:AraC-like DNA-binding protein
MIPQIVSPPEILKPFVKYFWTLNSDIDSPLKTLSAFPDGCPGIIMFQSEGGAICDNFNKKLPEVYLHGQTIAPSKASYYGRFSVVGVSFQPHALESIFGIDANELTQTGIDFSLVQRKKHGNLVEQIVHEESAAGKINILSDYLVNQQQNNDRQTDAVTRYALSLIIQSKGNIPLKELHQQVQLSERSLQRKFNQSIGISPKLFSRICRFQQSLNQLRTSAYNKLSDIAYENEYADQSHLVRAFKEFTGLSPLAFKKQSEGVMENVARSAD